MSGLRSVATILIFLGSVSVVTSIASMTQSRAISTIQMALATMYGVAAIATGLLLWRRSAGARTAYLLWCVTVLLYVMTVPELIRWPALPGLVAAVGILSWCYRYISRSLDSADTTVGRWS